MTTHFLNSPGIFSEKYMDETFPPFPRSVFNFLLLFFPPLLSLSPLLPQKIVIQTA